MGDLIDRAEGSAEIDFAVNRPLAVKFTAEFLAEIPHDIDVRSSEPVNGLPIIADCEDLRISLLRLQCFDQLSPAARDVLKLIHQNMFERAAVFAALCIVRRPEISYPRNRYGHSAVFDILRKPA